MSEQEVNKPEEQAAPVAGEQEQVAPAAAQVEGAAAAVATEAAPVCEKPVAAAGEQTAVAPAEATNTDDQVTEKTNEESQAEQAATEKVVDNDKPSEPVAAADVKMEVDAAKVEPTTDDKTDSGDKTLMTSVNVEPTVAPVAPVAPTSAPVELTMDANEKKGEPVTDENIAAAPQSQPPPPQQAQNKEPAKQPVLPTRQYLDSTVVPILHSALSQLAKVRPEDPITYLANFLLDCKNNFKSN